MKTKSFLIRLFWLIFASLAVVHIFTVSIDPYIIFGPNAFNKPRSGFERFSLSKAFEKNRNDFEFVIVGSSRAKNIQALTIEKITNQKAFNYSLDEASLEDYIAIVNHVVHTGKSKTIYLQLDFYNFSETSRTLHRILKTPLKKYLFPFIKLDENDPIKLRLFNKLYFSLKSFTDAYKCLKFYVKNNIIKNVKLSQDKPTPKVIPAPPKIVHYKAKVRLAWEGFKRFYNGFDLNGANEVKLKKWLGFIKKMTTENNIKLIVAMSPMNKQHLERLQMDVELTNHWLKVKRIIADGFGSFYDFNNCSTSSFRGSLYWFDSVHYNKELAAIMLQVLLDQPDRENIPESFGIQVTPETFDDYLLSLNELCAKS